LLDNSTSFPKVIKGGSVLGKCFDAMLYTANWGSYQLAFRFPKSAINIPALKPYCIGNVIEVSTTAEYVILNIEIHPRDGGRWIEWIEEDNGWLSELIPLRQAILLGDYRVLYLAWLQAAAISSYFEDEDEDNIQEPPIPPNLKTFTPPLQSFADWLEIDVDLIAAAVQTSPTQTELEEPFQDWVMALCDREKTQLLMEIITGDSIGASQLQALLRQKFAHTNKHLPLSSINRRCFSELTILAETECSLRQTREKSIAQAKRHQYLKSLQPQQAKIWSTIHYLIPRKKAKFYEQAVQHLIDLRDLADLEGSSAIFQSKVRQIQADYSSLSSLLRRMRQAQLLSDK